VKLIIENKGEKIKFQNEKIKVEKRERKTSAQTAFHTSTHPE